MGLFSYISVGSYSEFEERFRVFNIFGKGFKKIVLPYMSDYVSATAADMGISNNIITGCKISLPPVEDELIKKKLSKALMRARHLGADVAVIDPVIQKHIDEINGMEENLKISTGMIYPPIAFLEGIKKTSALMGIDFVRARVCIADAGNPMGEIMTELLSREVIYLTLCTFHKEKIMSKLNNYILNTGISPAVISDYRKASSDCDILVYTGGDNIHEIIENVHHKILIVNLSENAINLKKNFLIIDEVIIKGEREPEINGKNIDKKIFLTSKMWEGALLTNCNIDTLSFSLKKAEKMEELSKEWGLQMENIVSNGRILDRDGIYRYR